ncbi:interleukin-17C [Dugong dugon]
MLEGLHLETPIGVLSGTCQQMENRETRRPSHPQLEQSRMKGCTAAKRDARRSPAIGPRSKHKNGVALGIKGTTAHCSHEARRQVCLLQAQPPLLPPPPPPLLYPRHWRHYDGELASAPGSHLGRACLALKGWEFTDPGLRHLLGVLLLLWLPTSLAHHSTPLWKGPHTHETRRCYSADELPLGQPPRRLLPRGARWEQALPVTLVSSLEVAGHRKRHDRSLADTQCPVLRPEQVLEAEIHQRSISPWRYRIDTDENRYPQKLAFAECLCRGCISARTGRETTALNSVQLHQSLLVLKRRPCAPDGADIPQPGAVTFHTEFIRVPVGCTCVLPRSTR